MWQVLHIPPSANHAAAQRATTHEVLRVLAKWVHETPAAARRAIAYDALGVLHVLRTHADAEARLLHTGVRRAAVLEARVLPHAPALHPAAQRAKALEVLYVLHALHALPAHAGTRRAETLEVFCESLPNASSRSACAEARLAKTLAVLHVVCPANPRPARRGHCRG